MLATQLHLERLGSGRARLKLRRPYVSPVVRRLAEHVWRVRGYHPYPDLLAVAAEAALAWIDATTEEQREAVRAKVLRLRVRRCRRARRGARPIQRRRNHGSRRHPSVPPGHRNRAESRVRRHE